MSVIAMLTRVGKVHSERRLLVKVAVVVIVSLLSIVTMGVPALLMLAGASSFAVITSKWVGALSGPASWAAGIVLEASLIGVESGALALVAPHPHQQFVYVLQLILPLLGALALWTFLATTGRMVSEVPHDRRSGEPVLALIVIILIEIMFEVIKLRGRDFGLSWAMDGDSRNHVVITRAIMSAGGITLKELRVYPALINAITAVLDGASGRVNLLGGVLLTRDLQAQADVIILSCIGIAILFVAAVAETVPRAAGLADRLPKYMTIPLLACGCLSISSLVLGFVIVYGFLSAIGSMVFVLASIVLGMRIVRQYSHMTLILMVMTLFLVVTSWTLLVVVPATTLIVGLGIATSRLRSARRQGFGKNETFPMELTILVSLLCLGAVVIAVLMNRARLLSAIGSPGGFAHVDLRLYVLLGITALLTVLLAPNRQQRDVRSLSLLAYVFAGGAALWVRALGPIGGSWSYYAGKLLWLVTCCFLWVPFTLAIDLLRKANAWYANSGARLLSMTLISVTCSVALLTGLSDQSVYPLPFAWAITGAALPSPREVALVIRQADVSGPFVIWNYYSHGEDKLGNFWSALVWDYSSKGLPYPWPRSHLSFEYWAYFEDYKVASLCTAITNDPLRVVTQDRTLISSLWTSCPASRRDSRLVTSFTQ